MSTTCRSTHRGRSDVNAKSNILFFKVGLGLSLRRSHVCSSVIVSAPRGMRTLGHEDVGAYFGYWGVHSVGHFLLERRATITSDNRR